MWEIATAQVSQKLSWHQTARRTIIWQEKITILHWNQQSLSIKYETIKIIEKI